MKNEGVKSIFPTLIDVAKCADVSPITVSRVYNPKWEGKVKQATVDKVHKAAKELGYNPNRIARSLNSHRTDIIAVVMGMETGYFYGEVLNELIAKIQESGRQALIFVADITIGMEKVVDQVNQYRVDAIIVTAPALKSNIMNYFTNSKIPIIIFNREVENSNASAVWSDSIKAVYEVAEFLVENKYEKIGYIAGKHEEERNESFIKKLAEYNIKPIHVIEGGYDYKSGYEIATKMIASNNVPDVIFSCGDIMAMGAMDAARLRYGLNVPNDISIIGFDDTSAASLGAYDLTTMKQPLHKMVEATIEVIDELLENPEKQVIRRLEMELVIRSSTKINLPS
ncbi:LacI family DNA-binding transcriptional regulator [Clostridium sp. DL1XJH146]